MTKATILLKVAGAVLVVVVAGLLVLIFANGTGLNVLNLFSLALAAIAAALCLIPHPTPARAGVALAATGLAAMPALSSGVGYLLLVSALPLFAAFLWLRRDAPKPREHGESSS